MENTKEEKEAAMFSLLNIGMVVYDNNYKQNETSITNLTTNTIEVYLTKKSPEGINCTQWFIIKDFFERFSLNKI